MTQDSNNSHLSPLKLENVIIDVSHVTADSESVERVTQRVLAATSPVAATQPVARQPIRRMIAAAIGITTVMLVVGILSMPALVSSTAFAQAQRHVEKTHSVSFVEYMTEAAAKREIQEAENLLKMRQIEMESLARGKDARSKEQEEVEENFQKRVRQYTALLRSKLKNGDPIESRRVWIQGRYLYRSEQSAMGSKIINITNAKTGESVTLNPGQKTCTLMKTQTVLNMKSGEKTVTPIGPNPARNFYSQFVEVPSDNVKDAGSKTIHGRSAAGFERIVDDRGITYTTTYWIDETTKLPVQIEAAVRRDGVVMGGSTISDLTFDTQLDPAPFSTSPPKGYTVSSGGFMSLDTGD